MTTPGDEDAEEKEVKEGGGVKAAAPTGGLATAPATIRMSPLFDPYQAAHEAAKAAAKAQVPPPAVFTVPMPQGALVSNVVSGDPDLPMPSEPLARV